MSTKVHDSMFFSKLFNLQITKMGECEKALVCTHSAYLYNKRNIFQTFLILYVYFANKSHNNNNNNKMKSYVIFLFY